LAVSLKDGSNNRNLLRLQSSCFPNLYLKLFFLYLEQSGQAHNFCGGRSSGA